MVNFCDIDMALRWVFTCLLLWGLSCWTVWGEIVPCMRTMEECRSTGYSSMSAINSNYYCCAPGYRMSMRNAQCSCTKTAEAVQCSKGPEACHNAHSVSRDGQGNTVCCQRGFSMRSQSSSINGQQISSCSCTRRLSSGSGNIISFSNKNKVNIGKNNNNGSSVNNTVVEERRQNLNRKFRNSMRKGMQAMAKQMQAMMKQMQSATKRLEKMRARMESFFANMFRG